MRFILLASLLLSSYLLNAQCTYLAYDGFDYAANTATEGIAGGTGWQSPWNVQNDDLIVPGYNIVANSLTFSNLQVVGNSASGGSSYLTAGRRLNTSDNGPFTDYVASGNDGIGTTTGDTLWTSFLLNKNLNNDQSLFVSLHNDNLDWCNDCTTEKIAIGYFGTNSNSNGQRYWSLLLNGTYYQSNVPVVVNQAALLVVRIVFAAGNTQVDLYVDPTTIGNNGTPAPTLTQSTGSENVIRSVATYLGNIPDQAKIDEIRIGTSYACVTPDPNVNINLPPTASISMTPASGVSPLNVTLDGSGSYDPENQSLTYEWDFGDGSPTSNAMNPPVHLYDELGELVVTLTVTDNVGQQHVAYSTLTLLDENSTFPCQASVSCLQMASCSADDAIIRANVGNQTFDLTNEADQSMTATNYNEFHGLAAGAYTLAIAGNGSSCSDTFELVVKVDSSTCVGWEPSGCAMEIGTNITGLADWSVERPFRNLMKNVRPSIITFSDGCNCWDAEVTDQMSIDTAGYPTFLPQTTSIGSTKVRYVLSSDGGNMRPDSSYVLMYDGDGDLEIFGVTIQSDVPNRLQFIAGTGNIVININQSTNGNHLRNFRLTKLSDEFSDLISNPFYQSFVDKITPFSLIRFMDWGNTNNSPQTSWIDRSSQSYFTYATGNGVPYEMMVQLANQLQQDVWLCVPHQADDHFIEQMAILFRDNLDSDITIYVEYSNEVWNWIFDQAHYNVENKPSNLSYGRAMADKAKNVFEIWHGVFGSDACRVKRVVGLQGGFNTLNQDIISQLGHDGWDYGSPTHYFGLDHSDQGNPVLSASSTYQDVMTNSRNNFASFSQDVKQDYRNVQIFGKEVITYEGGQHFVGNVFGIPYDYQQAMWDAQNSNEMYDMYMDVHDSIRRWGCKLAANFSLSSVQESVYGSWGVLPDIDVQPPYSTTAKKYQALLDNLPDSNCSRAFTWNGEYSSSWSDPCNWNQTRIPGSSDNVFIPASTPHNVNVDMNGEVRSLRVAVGAMMTILMGWELQVE